MEKSEAGQNQGIQEKQNLPYDKKLERQAGIAWEYYKRISEMGSECHVSVGGLDSITLYIWLLSLGIDVPAISVTGIEDITIQRVHKAIGITKVAPYKSKIQVLREFGFPVISKKIAGRIDMLQMPRQKMPPSGMQS